MIEDVERHRAEIGPKLEALLRALAFWSAHNKLRIHYSFKHPSWDDPPSAPEGPADAF